MTKSKITLLTSRSFVSSSLSLRFQRNQVSIESQCLHKNSGSTERSCVRFSGISSTLSLRGRSGLRSSFQLLNGNHICTGFSGPRRVDILFVTTDATWSTKGHSPQTPRSCHPNHRHEGSSENLINVLLTKTRTVTKLS